MRWTCQDVNSTSIPQYFCFQAASRLRHVEYRYFEAVGCFNSTGYPFATPGGIPDTFGRRLYGRNHPLEWAVMVSVFTPLGSRYSTMLHYLQMSAESAGGPYRYASSLAGLGASLTGQPRRSVHQQRALESSSSSQSDELWGLDTDQSCLSYVVFDDSAQVRLTAVYSMGKTVFLILVVGFGAVLFTHDAQVIRVFNNLDS